MRKGTPKPRGIPETGKCGLQGRGCTGEGRLVLDPYDADVNNHEVWGYLCEVCEQESALDI